MGVSGKLKPSVSSTSVSHSSFVNCGGMSLISFTRMEAVPVPVQKRIIVYGIKSSLLDVSPSTFQASTVHGDHLNRIVRCTFSV